jgi:hypothetical protein
MAGFETVPARGVFALPWVQVSIIYAEVLSGLWFLLSKNSSLQWLAALTLFAGFTAVNLYQGLQGEASCGCFGPLRANPWIVFGVNITVVASLTYFRPTFDQFGTRREVKRFVVLVSALGLFVSLALASLFFGFGPFDRLTALLRLEPYYISPQAIDFGIGTPGQIKDADLLITNLSDKPIRVVGGSSSCSFVAMGDYPVVVEPGESRSMRIRVSYPVVPGSFAHTGTYFIDAGGLEVARFQLIGTIDQGE